MNLNSAGPALEMLREVGIRLLETFALVFVAETIFLFLALLALTRVQKLPARPLALLAVAILACVLNCVPVVGIFLAAIALLLCMTKMVGARTFTDVIFTVGVASVLTFCFNLLVVPQLLNNSHLTLLVRARTAELARIVAAGTNTAATNQPIVTSADFASGTPGALPAAGGPAVPTATAPAPAPAPTAPANNTYSPRAGKMASEIFTHFDIHGYTRGPVQTIALISDGTHSYDVGPGDIFQIETSLGKADVTCEHVDPTKVVLNVEGVTVTIIPKKEL